MVYTSHSSRLNTIMFRNCYLHFVYRHVDGNHKLIRWKLIVHGGKALIYMYRSDCIKHRSA